MSLRQTVRALHVEPSLVDYAVRLVEKSRTLDAVELGGSPRASIYLIEAARARAFLEQRDYVLPEDVKRVAPVGAAPPPAALLRGRGRGLHARRDRARGAGLGSDAVKPDPIRSDAARASRALRVRARRDVSTSLTGAYRSAFRGQGLTFEELRDYAPGDDVRWLEWNATARMGRPIVKRMREERDVVVALLVDLSPVARVRLRGRDQARSRAPRGGGAGRGRDRRAGPRRARGLRGRARAGASAPHRTGRARARLPRAAKPCAGSRHRRRARARLGRREAAAPLAWWC